MMIHSRVPIPFTHRFNTRVIVLYTQRYGDIWTRFR